MKALNDMNFTEYLFNSDINSFYSFSVKYIFFKMNIREKLGLSRKWSFNNSLNLLKCLRLTFWKSTLSVKTITYFEYI